MPFREAAFWVGLTMFGTGIYFIFERLDQLHIFVAAAFILLGIAGMAYSVYRHHYPDANLPSVTAWIWVPLAILALCAIGYDSLSNTQWSTVTWDDSQGRGRENHRRYSPFS